MTKLSKTDIKIQLYCRYFVELLTDLENIRPSDKSLQLLKTVVNGMILYDSVSFVYQVMDYINPYSKQIMEKNSDFFLKDLVSEFDTEDTSFIADEIKKIHIIWIDPDTTELTKESIWKYFQNFVKIGKLIRAS
jgi:hypothetical protein